VGQALLKGELNILDFHQRLLQSGIVSLGEPELFRVRDSDGVLYGPVGLSTLIQWVHEKRVLPESLIRVESESRWHQAQDLASLQGYFSPQEKPAPGAVHFDPIVITNPEELRQFPIFAGLSDKQLQQLVTLSDCFEVAPRKVIVRQGEPCDAIYFVLSGTLRVRLLMGVKNHDTTLRRISGGEFFGEVGMLLRSTRMADVVTETKARLLRLSADAFQSLIKEAPELAGPLLFSLAVTMAQHMAEDNRRSSRGPTPELLLH
jgi:Cyclic nucleotide-binding domain